MAEERVNIGNIKTTIGLKKNQVLSDVLDNYIEESKIVTDLSQNVDNTQVVGASVLKSELDSKLESSDIANKVDKVTGKGLSTEDFTTELKTKLENMDGNATTYVHPTQTSHENGFYKVTVDGTGHITDVVAVAKTDITALGIPSQDTTYSNATTTTDGLMSSSDKSKLNGIEAQANKYVHPTYTSKTQKLYKVAVDSTGHISSVSEVTKADITALGIPSDDTTYSLVSTTKDGLMSSSDKVKLNGIEAQANKTVVDTALSSSSTNPVQNKVVNGLATRISNLETNSLSIEVIASGESLPQTGSKNKLYFIQNADSGTNNAYDEYAWTGTAYELVGHRELDLTGYVQIADLKNHISAEIVTTGANAGDINLIFS